MDSGGRREGREILARSSPHPLRPSSKMLSTPHITSPNCAGLTQVQLSGHFPAFLLGFRDVGGDGPMFRRDSLLMDE